MAKRIYFLTDNEKIYKEIEAEFEYFNGFAKSQKQKSIKSFHEAIKKQYPDKKILEISTKSENLGTQFSAFNLTLDGYSVECIFQSAKVFKDKNKEYSFKEILYEDKSLDSKNCIKEFLENHKTAKLSHFEYENKRYELEPKSSFYDFIYIQALMQSKDAEKLVEYDIFTDIEFNQKKQINCQARSCAIYVSLVKNKKVDYYMSSFENFKKIYNQKEPSLFD
ncbi:hypothetical protein OLQ22_08215 [Campylobacter jejuni]|nr:hypothetical protein [Campylobacter jejuni]